jgi:hypothetical protein
MEVSGRLRTPANLLEAKVSQVPSGQEAESAQSRFNRWGKVNLYPCLIN